MKLIIKLRMTEKCPTCNKTVYFAERIRSIGKDWHRMCLKCNQCGKVLGSYIHDYSWMWINLVLFSERKTCRTWRRTVLRSTMLRGAVWTKGIWPGAKRIPCLRPQITNKKPGSSILSVQVVWPRDALNVLLEQQQTHNKYSIFIFFYIPWFANLWN